MSTFIVQSTYINIPFVLYMYSEEATSENLFILKLRDQFLAGDEEAYSQIYRLYAKELYAFGISLNVAPNEIVEDAIHDVFVEIYTRRENLRKVNNLKFYFIVAFRNRLFLLVNKNVRSYDINNVQVPEMSERDYEEIWIEKEIEDEKLKMVREILSYLNTNQREAIYHRFIEGLSCEEISHIMGINYQSAKNLIYRALKKIKSLTVLSVILYVFFIFFV
ncbi:hypothetical protein SDC9_133552 [bioreactor metagenome]|uniref:RNA polymerase sigma factor 70 region 4 type 2 domain-containing protein n=1 Tax=bioreactor metagenome TaxID=1076179 RepID=A0A645DC04_9ZZZZ|nr:sigma-70 family RNA polymerase sigma factor [Paludibacter sp.]